MRKVFITGSLCLALTFSGSAQVEIHRGAPLLPTATERQSNDLLAQGNREESPRVIMRTSIFAAGKLIGSHYSLEQDSGGHWTVRTLDRNESNPGRWTVHFASMDGPEAGYVQFKNLAKETKVIDVLMIDCCFDLLGEPVPHWNG